MSVKCVMQCLSKTEPAYPEGPVQVVLQPMYSDDKGNRFLNDFARYTPCGRVELTIDNQSATDQFQVGQYYDLVFTERPTPQPDPT